MNKEAQLMRFQLSGRTQDGSEYFKNQNVEMLKSLRKRNLIYEK